MKKEYNLAIVIGRFQPFHNGHNELLKKAQEVADSVLVFIGSSNSPIGYKNPWSFEDRKWMVSHGCDLDFSSSDMNGIGNTIVPLPDVWNNDEKWVSNVRFDVDKKKELEDDKVCIVGYEKDDSSYYLKMFPEYDFVPVEHFGTLSSTHIREDYFRKAPHLPNGLVPDAVWDFMKEYYNSDKFRYVLSEYEGKRDYDKLWENAPYPPTFVTVDNVVTHAGKILLVERGGWPGRGLLALPGGFVDPSKGDSFDNAVAELYEETGLSDDFGRIPQGKLKAYYDNREGKRFDDPGRSIRGYTLTTAFRVRLEPNKKYRIKGGDDAVRADWYNFNEIRQDMMFEDHYGIIQEML